MYINVANHQRNTNIVFLFIRNIKNTIKNKIPIKVAWTSWRQDVMTQKFKGQKIEILYSKVPQNCN